MAAVMWVRKGFVFTDSPQDTCCVSVIVLLQYSIVQISRAPHHCMISILHEMIPRPFVENTAWCILVEKVLGYDLQVLNT